MEDYENMGLWQLFIRLCNSNCKKIDPYVSDKLNSVDDIFTNHYSLSRLCVTPNSEYMPLTFKKINSILTSFLNEETINQYLWRLKTIKHWIDDKVKNIILNLWLMETSLSPQPLQWIYRSISSNHELYIPILIKLIKNYNKSRTKDKIDDIHGIFLNANIKNLPEVCELLAEATPAITVGLLNREDVSEKYIMKGLKALSKLRRQKDIKTKIDFEALEHLGAKARLNVMRQLMGVMHKRYYKSQIGLPFKEHPTRESVKKFLFPCVFEYNQEVSNLMERFDKLQKES